MKDGLVVDGKDLKGIPGQWKRFGPARCTQEPVLAAGRALSELTAHKCLSPADSRAAEEGVGSEAGKRERGWVQVSSLQRGQVYCKGALAREQGAKAP